MSDHAGVETESGLPLDEFYVHKPGRPATTGRVPVHKRDPR